MSIALDTIYQDLNALTEAELEKLQLAVGEIAARLQSERLAKRIEKAVIEAQAVGFNDTEISTIIDETTAKARKGKADKDFDPTINVEPAQRGPSALKGTK